MNFMVDCGQGCDVFFSSMPLGMSVAVRAGQNELAAPSAAVRLGRLCCGSSTRRRCPPAELAGRTSARHFGRLIGRPDPPPPHIPRLGTPLHAERSEPSVECSELQKRFGYPHIRRCIHKAVHTQGGLWPPQESCYLRGVRGLAPASSEASRLSSTASCRKGSAIPKQGGAYTRRCTHKAVHTRGLWPLHESCYLRGVRGLAPASSEASRLSSTASCRKGSAFPTQGGAYTRRCIHKAVHTQGGLWPPQESCYLASLDAGRGGW